MSIAQHIHPARQGHFRPRQMRFDLRESLATDWHGGSPFRTAWFNAMSMLFPLGEKFFIDTVRAYADRIEDETLRADVRAFQGQESIHRREHQRYNEALCEARGYDLEEFEGPVRRRIAWAKDHFNPRRLLAGTVANEHLTAIMAHDLLSHDDALAGADPAIAELWRWHAVEETEHKAVAFDVHRLVGGTTKERRHALVMSSFFFMKDTLRITRSMLKQDGQLWRWRTWWDGFQFLIGRPGTLRRIVPAWLSFLRQDFHPWQHDNRELVERYELARKG
ncbi:MAG: metal-dependent hydrolase [Gammaproteobacteria bacterium]